MTAPTARKRNAIEWTAFGLGTALTLGIAGFLVWQSVQGSGTADLRVDVASVDESRSGVDVTARIHNAGDAGAQDVEAEVCDGRNNCVTFSFAQLPAGSSDEHVVRFDSASRPYTGRVLGWRVGG
jgi:uncharacterized protein (TIGR02588 family)